EVFERSVYEFDVPSNTERFSVIGNVTATNVHRDSKLSYHLASRHPIFLVIPKTGELLLIAKPEPKNYNLSLYASDNQKPLRKRSLVSVVIRVFNDDEINDANVDKANVINVGKGDRNTDDEYDSIAIQMRRKRSVRPPKSYQFKEADGASPGTIMFNLDKKHSQEVFKLESANRWVTVDTTGAVRVKEPWDYEQLEKHKTIDFWVFVTGPNLNDPERQSITIHIRDVNDEPPYFINRPLPMQAVVQLNAPPGTSVFKLQARDPDTDHNIHYFLVRDRTIGRFEVDERSGEVRTRGNEPFLLDKEYVLYVKAEDHNGPMGDR
ncbi:Pt1-cadherin-like protein, partial [Leptotrombidium deliense]